MIERDKQSDDQQKKHALEKEKHEQTPQDAKAKSKQPKARMTTDPQAPQDKGYVERIDEKTSKH